MDQNAGDTFDWQTTNKLGMHQKPQSGCGWYADNDCDETEIKEKRYMDFIGRMDK